MPRSPNRQDAFAFQCCSFALSTLSFHALAPKQFVPKEKGSDGIVGAAGPVIAGECLQAKGFAYTLMDLLADRDLVRQYQQGSYVTLRLTAGMYHRFHAPADCEVQHVSYISGDTWNVNPIALQRVENLFCKNERAVIRLRLEPSGHIITLVPVAAILVASP